MRTKMEKGKKETKEKRIKSNKGITILALVITVIVLLILAGITINTLSSDNGAIINASKAKFRTEIRDIEEKIELEEINHNNGEDFQFGSLKDLIGREDAYNEILYMEDGKLVYIEDKVSEKQAEWLEEMDIQAKQNIIPIYTGEQFKKIGTGEEITIEEAGGEIYQFNIDSHYVLQNDINLNCSEENQWMPIGTLSNPFKGILDEKNYKIKGIYMDGGEHKALFNYNSGKIQNVVLDDGYINATNYIAGIVAINNANAEIINCINQVEIHATYITGGIVGRNYGLVENCENRAYLELSSNSGGICGDNRNIIRRCFNSSEILLIDWGIGGIAGTNFGTVEECYNLGNILAPTSYARYSKGGIVGSNYGTITRCYNLATVTGNTSNWNIGGIAGSNEQNGIIGFSYNAGEVIGYNNVGGIAGNTPGTIRHCYTIDTNAMAGSGTENLENCLQLSEKQMKNQENIKLEDGSTTTFLALLNKEEEYFMEDTENKNNEYPVLKQNS